MHRRDRDGNYPANQTLLPVVQPSLSAGEPALLGETLFAGRTPAAVGVPGAGLRSRCKYEMRPRECSNSSLVGEKRETEQGEVNAAAY